MEADATVKPSFAMFVVSDGRSVDAILQIQTALRSALKRLWLEMQDLTYSLRNGDAVWMKSWRTFGTITSVHTHDASSASQKALLEGASSASCVMRVIGTTSCSVAAVISTYAKTAVATVSEGNLDGK